jgi:hypothetical protein
MSSKRSQNKLERVRLERARLDQLAIAARVFTNAVLDGTGDKVSVGLVNDQQTELNRAAIRYGRLFREDKDGRIIGRPEQIAVDVDVAAEVVGRG